MEPWFYQCVYIEMYTFMKPMKYTPNYLLAFILIFSTTACIGQSINGLFEINSSESKTITTSNAPQHITRTIIQDKNGTLWFATWDGIINYDGDSFKNITREVSLARFFSVLEDSKGNFWFASVGSGVYYYDGKSFQNFTTKDGLADNKVIYIHEDTKNNIWFATKGGLSRYNGNHFQNFTTNQDLMSNEINTILEDKTGNIWIGTKDKASIYIGETFNTLTNNSGIAFTNVRHIIEDKQGTIWIAGNDGFWRYYDSKFTLISEQFTGYIYEDKIGNIWTSSESVTTNGWVLSRYNQASLKSNHPTAIEIKTEKGMLFGISEDSYGNIWVGTLHGVYRYDSKIINLAKYAKDEPAFSTQQSTK